MIKKRVKKTAFCVLNFQLSTFHFQLKCSLSPFGWHRLFFEGCGLYILLTCLEVCVLVQGR